MKPFLAFLLAAVASLSPLATPARADVSFSVFYSDLEPYGEWFDHADYGYVWRPYSRVTYDGWRPYSDGYWAHTDYGWTWVSYEDWGWATYHYGRWAYLRGYGWIWVPGYEWAPAWVSWRSSDDYVGWAPLPPRARWNTSIGFSFWVDRDYDIGPGYYNFCESRHFGAPSMRYHLRPVHQNVTIIERTTNITNISIHKTVNKNIIYNGGPDYDRISRRSERPIPKLRVERVRERDSKERTPKARDGTLQVVAPEILIDPAVKAPKVKERIRDKELEEGGWDIAKDEPSRKRLRDKIRTEAGPATTQAPARPPKEEQVAGFVPDPPKDKKGPAKDRTDAGEGSRRDKADRGQGREPGAEPTPPILTQGREKADDTPRKDKADRGPGRTPQAEPTPPIRVEPKTEDRSREEERAKAARIEEMRRKEAERFAKDAEVRRKQAQQHEADQNARKAAEDQRSRREAEYRAIEEERRKKPSASGGGYQNPSQSDAINRSKRQAEEQEARSRAQAEAAAERNRQARKQQEEAQRQSSRSQPEAKPKKSGNTNRSSSETTSNSTLTEEEMQRRSGRGQDRRHKN